MTDERIRPTFRRDTARWVHSAGLMLAAIGILVQFLTGVPGFPPIPPGPIILAAMAVVVLLVPWRWIVALGIAVALFVTVGAIASGETIQLLSTGAPWGQLLGVFLQILGILVALVAGTLALSRRSGRTEVR